MSTTSAMHGKFVQHTPLTVRTTFYIANRKECHLSGHSKVKRTSLCFNASLSLHDFVFFKARNIHVGLGYTAVVIQFASPPSPSSKSEPCSGGRPDQFDGLRVKHELSFSRPRWPRSPSPQRRTSTCVVS